MAEDKKKEADGKAEDGKKKKKGLPPIVLIALGAIVGGAGVVFAVPPKVKEVVKEEPHFEEEDYTHPDPIKKTFNPHTRAGKATARVEFKFVYTARSDHETQAFDQIKQNWESALHGTLMLLMNRSMEELRSETGMRILEKDMIDELDRVLFPKGADKVARVTRVMWVDWLFQ